MSSATKLQQREIRDGERVNASRNGSETLRRNREIRAGSLEPVVRTFRNSLRQSVGSIQRESFFQTARAAAVLSFDQEIGHQVVSATITVLSGGRGR